MNQLQFESEFAMEAEFHTDLTKEEIYLIIEQASYLSEYERLTYYNALVKMMKAYH